MSADNSDEAADAQIKELKEKCEQLKRKRDEENSIHRSACFSRQRRRIIDDFKAACNSDEHVIQLAQIHVGPDAKAWFMKRGFTFTQYYEHDDPNYIAYWKIKFPV